MSTRIEYPLTGDGMCTRDSDFILLDSFVQICGQELPILISQPHSNEVLTEYYLAGYHHLSPTKHTASTIYVIKIRIR